MLAASFMQSDPLRSGPCAVPRRKAALPERAVQDHVIFSVSSPCMRGRVRRREFIMTLGGAAVMPLAARAQQPARPPRMAMFHPAIAPALLTETGGGSAWRAFFGELRRLGYVEGQSLIIERYWAEGRHDRYAEVAREIATRNPDVIVTGTNPVVTVFKAATGTIPIVAFMLDPAGGTGDQPGAARRQPHRHHA
jgi:hypothetical protein